MYVKCMYVRFETQPESLREMSARLVAPHIFSMDDTNLAVGWVVVDRGGFPFLSFCAHVSPASCARTSAVEDVLDSGTPPFRILDLPLVGFTLLANLCLPLFYVTHPVV